MYGRHMTETQQVPVEDVQQLPGQVVIENLWIPGRPKPKGSLKNIAPRNQRARMVEQVEGSTEWKRRVRNAVVRHVQDPATTGLPLDAFPITDAVEVEVTFYFASPADPANEDYPCGLEGDTDKLIRNVGDALTESGLIKDDRQIVGWVASKRFVGIHGVTMPNEEGLHLFVVVAP